MVTDFTSNGMSSVTICTAAPIWDPSAGSCTRHTEEFAGRRSASATWFAKHGARRALDARSDVTSVDVAEVGGLEVPPDLRATNAAACRPTPLSTSPRRHSSPHHLESVYHTRSIHAGFDRRGTETPQQPRRYGCPSGSVLVSRWRLCRLGHGWALPRQSNRWICAIAPCPSMSRRTAGARRGAAAANAERSADRPEPARPARQASRRRTPAFRRLPERDRWRPPDVGR